MRKGLLLVWLLLPVLVGFYHAGPGQERALLDEVDRIIRQAERQIAQEQWATAEESYSAALELLPNEQLATQRRLRLERAKAQLRIEKLPDAYAELTSLVGELKQDKQADPQLLSEARAALANTQYYLTWLMRLEGESRDQWEAEIEAARQTYRLLAEQADAQDDESAAQRCREDLEAAIRLARMDLSDLQALALPSQCKGCCSGQCKGNGKGKGKGRGKGTQRAKDARGASSGPPPDGGGS